MDTIGAVAPINLCAAGGVRVRIGIRSANVEQKMMTYEEQEQARQERLSEVGTEPDCPFCGKPRVARSSYIRCNQCGVNWGAGEDIMRDPRLSHIKTIAPTNQAQSDGVLIAM